MNRVPRFIVELLIAVIVLVTAFYAGKISHSFVKISPDAVREISSDELAQVIKDRQVNVVDARDRRSFAKGHIPGAINLPEEDFSNAYAREKGRLSDPNRLIIVYCSHRYCTLSDLVIEKLAACGHRRLEKFTEGWDAWEEAGLPKE